MSRTSAYLALLAAVAIWGFNFHTVHIGLLHFSLLAFLTLRFSIAAASYLPKIFNQSRRPLHSDFIRARQVVSRTRYVLSALAVAACLATFYLLQSARIRETWGTVDAAFLTATVVFWVPALTKLFFPKRSVFTLDVVIGVGLCLAGLLCVEGIPHSSLPTANLLALAGAVALGLELLIIGEIAPRLQSSELIRWTALYTAFAAGILAVLWLVLDPTFMVIPPAASKAPEWAKVPLAGIMCLLFAALAATALANFLANWGNAQKNANGDPIITATHRGLLENLDAPLSLVFASILFPWNISDAPLTLAGYALIAVGVLLAELKIPSRLIARRQVTDQ